MSSFKNKFASLVQDLRNKKSREFSRQPQPAYSEHFAVPPPPPPPIPQEYRKETSDAKSTKSGKGDKADKSERPPSRSGSILRRIGSKTSLKELRRKSSFAGRSSTSVNNYGLQNDQPPVPTPQETQTRQQSVELTPPPSAGKRSPPPPLNTNITQNQHTPPSGNYDDSEDDLYSDPVRDRQKAEAAAGITSQLPSPPGEKAGPVAQAPPQPVYTYTGPPQRPQMFIPGTNSQVLPTIPASPASTMHSPTSPTGTNPFRKFGSVSPNLAEVADGPFKPISPVLEQRESPTLDTNVPRPRDDDFETASPTTATKGLMNGLRFSFAPPPVEATAPVQITPPTSTSSSPIMLADNNPFKHLADAGGSSSSSSSVPPPPPPSAFGPGRGPIKAIAPPLRDAPPPPVPTNNLERSASGKAPQFKRAPSGKAKAPEGFAPPPPPPMALPQGWTARWDEKEQKFAYYQGTRGKSEQWEMPTEPAKKMSMRDRRMRKKKEVQNTIASLPSYAEANSPTTGSSSSGLPPPAAPPSLNNLVQPNPSS